MKQLHSLPGLGMDRIRVGFLCVYFCVIICTGRWVGWYNISILYVRTPYLVLPAYQHSDGDSQLNFLAGNIWRLTESVLYGIDQAPTMAVQGIESVWWQKYFHKYSCLEVTRTRLWHEKSVPREEMLRSGPSFFNDRFLPKMKTNCLYFGTVRCSPARDTIDQARLAVCMSGPEYSLLVLGISETLEWWLDWFLSDVQRIGKQILSVQDFDKNLAVQEWLRIWIPMGSRNPIVKPWNDVNFDDQHCCVCSRPQVYCDVKLGTGGGWRCSSHLVNHWLTVCVMME